MIEPATLAPEVQVALVAAQGGAVTTSIVRSSFPAQGAARDDQSENNNTANVLTGSRPNNLLDFSLIAILQGQGSDADSESHNTATNRDDTTAAQDDATAAKDDQVESDDALTAAEKRDVAELRSRDQEVRAHEQAHRTAGGNLTGQATFDFQTGPDGKRYAVSGEVPIDTSPENNPEDTIRKFEHVKRAANAPAQPSDQDRAVAAQTDAGQAQARAELAQLEQAERNEVRRQQTTEANDTASNTAADENEGVQLEQLGDSQTLGLQTVSANDNEPPRGRDGELGDTRFNETNASFTQGEGFNDAGNGGGVTAAVNPAFGAANPFEPVETFSGIIV